MNGGEGKGLASIPHGEKSKKIKLYCHM